MARARNRVRRLEPPPATLLSDYRAADPRAERASYRDAFATLVRGSYSLADFVEAFYSSWLFGLERWLLRRIMGDRLADTSPAEIARGEVDAFAVWRLGERRADELIVRDLRDHTRSWFRVIASAADGTGYTELQFGSVVVARLERERGAYALAPGFRRLLGFHRLYSRALLAAARARLLRG